MNGTAQSGGTSFHTSINNQENAPQRHDHRPVSWRKFLYSSFPFPGDSRLCRVDKNLLAPFPVIGGSLKIFCSVIRKKLSQAMDCTILIHVKCPEGKPRVKKQIIRGQRSRELLLYVAEHSMGLGRWLLPRSVRT